MGTLTGNVPRLDEHCPHKLATSCRLTSTLNCCACADERPHSRTYSVYIDGVGFVQRGTRWQSYCWFCKEFWNNRLASTEPPMQPSDTQIPLIPDQSTFLERWFEFHQGYRIVEREDGTEERISVIGEPFRDVSPGYLPRTLNELRSGRLNDASRPENRTRRTQSASELTSPSEPERSLEDALDALIEEASDSEQESPPTLRSVQSTDPPPAQVDPRETQRTESMRRAVDRVTRVFGTREEVESDDYQSPITAFYNAAWERHRRAEQERQGRGPEPLNIVPSSDPTPDIPETAGVVTERRELERLLEERSRSNRTLRRIETQAAIDRILNGVDRYSSALDSDTSPPTSGDVNDAASSSDLRSDSTETDTEVQRFREYLQAQRRQRERETSEAELTRRIYELDRGTSSLLSITRDRLAMRLSPRPAPEVPVAGLDSDQRPEAKSDEEMTVKLDCQVCYSQIANIACLPCGHMVMCQWCADITMPVRHANFPARASKCPMCRKKVTQRVKIHIAGEPEMKKLEKMEATEEVGDSIKA